MRLLDELERLSSWPEVSATHPHRFGGREFRFRAAEIGHVHTGGIVDIPFPRAVRNALLDEGLAEEHHWVPNSGWVTYRVRGENDLQHALWLMRLSYLRGRADAVHIDHVLHRRAQGCCGCVREVVTPLSPTSWQPISTVRQFPLGSKSCPIASFAGVGAMLPVGSND